MRSPCCRRGRTMAAATAIKASWNSPITRAAHGARTERNEGMHDGRRSEERGHGLAGGRARRHARRGLRARNIRAGALGGAERDLQEEASALDRPAHLFPRAAQAAVRADQAAGLGAAHQGQGRRAVRGPRLRPARAASSSASPSASTRASPASSRCRRRPSASARNGISSATCRICRPAARSCCSTAPGTTAPASSG